MIMVIVTDGFKHDFHRHTFRELESSTMLLRKVMQPAYPLALMTNATGMTAQTAAQWKRVTGPRRAKLWDIHRPFSMDDRILPAYEIWKKDRYCEDRRHRRWKIPCKAKKQQCQEREVAEYCPLTCGLCTLPVAATIASTEADGQDNVTTSDYEWKSVSFWKTSALLQSPFNRTIFLDNDVYVLQPGLMHSLLTRTLRVADIAMPVSTGRQGYWETAPLPALCIAMIAYHLSAEVQAYFVGAAGRLAAHTHDVPGVMQRDQEMLWFEWYQARPWLRMTVLPEEYYCPDVELDEAGGASWQLNWATDTHKGAGRLACKAVHGHSQYAVAQRLPQIRRKEANVRSERWTSYRDLVRIVPGPSHSPSIAAV